MVELRDEKVIHTTSIFCFKADNVDSRCANDD